MKCPVDNSKLVITERQGIEIDYCPDCRGVWLDRGELDKLLERSETLDRMDNFNRRNGGRIPSDDRDDFDMPRDHRTYPKKRRRNWLEEFFD